MRVSSGIPTDDSSPFDDRPSYEELSEQLAAVELVAETRSSASTNSRPATSPSSHGLPILSSVSAVTLETPPCRPRKRASGSRLHRVGPSAGPSSGAKESSPVLQVRTSLRWSIPTGDQPFTGACTHCGADLSDAEVIGVKRRQVFDLPQIHPFVTEHRIERRRCRCGCEVKAAIPANATAPACYGPARSSRPRLLFRCPSAPSL